MLRFVRENDLWRPAAGTFPGWPSEAKSITLLDPCCGSGHFLTEALPILAALRRAKEGLSARDAIAAVLRDNLFGLEIDGRCVQIAAFAVALVGWAVGGWQSLPRPHIAWVGAPPPLPHREFVALANGDTDLALGLAALHDLFARAPLLGSLIEPTGGDLMSPQRLGRLAPLLDKLVAKARRAELEFAEGAVAARGMADAAVILGGYYTLQTTNVPFLGRGKQDPDLAAFIGNTTPEAKADLATAMLARMLKMAGDFGVLAVVTPQNWYALDNYKHFRRSILENIQLKLAFDLGPAAFQDMNWWAARTALTVIERQKANENSNVFVFSAGEHKYTEEKFQLLLSRSPEYIPQSDQISNPDSRIVTEKVERGQMLSTYCDSRQGIKTGDDSRFRRMFWEYSDRRENWRFFQTSPEIKSLFDGCNGLIWWGNRGEDLARLQGRNSYGKFGCAIGQMNLLPNCIYTGEAFDSNVSSLVPKDSQLLPAIWCYISSSEYRLAVRKIEPGVKVNNATLIKVPYDHARWQKVAAEKYPNGLPEPYSDDPTQWLFHGHPAQAETSTALHVALARLVGYRWPAETDKDMRLSAEARAWTTKVAALPLSDNDGILCLPAVAGERSLADRLRTFLAAAFDTDWSDVKERQLVAEADARFEKKPPKDPSLEAWLRNRAFRQHCALFHDRPFLLQVWDGLKDSFSAFLHYHRLDQATLRRLTYTTLGDWLARAKADGSVSRQEKGRELQQALEKILEGETPYDIFVRWKPLASQPLGWNPDLDDGVRMNIRPFITAAILRDTPNIRWTKDRGTDVASAHWYHVFNGERINDHHTTLAEKHAAHTTAANREKATA